MKKNYILVVKSPFRGYKKGDQILDSEEVSKILESPYERKMVTKTMQLARVTQ